jgi:hypothetical protein
VVFVLCMLLCPTSQYRTVRKEHYRRLVDKLQSLSLLMQPSGAGIGPLSLVSLHHESCPCASRVCLSPLFWVHRLAISTAPSCLACVAASSSAIGIDANGLHSCIIRVTQRCRGPRGRTAATVGARVYRKANGRYPDKCQVVCGRPETS